jgi:PAS domain S-box-containing protein
LSRILLLLEHRENSRLLADWLSTRYEVIKPDDESKATAELLLSQPFDLCIVGARALNQLWQVVQDRRSTEQPVLLPVLLVTGRTDVSYVTRNLWQCIDELITQPIEKLELQARVEILLRSRQLSLQLQAANQQREQQVVARQQAETYRDLAIEAQQVDHTERRRATEALRENEQQLSLALKTGRLGSWQLDFKTGILSTSDQCKVNFGLPLEANFSHQQLFELIHPDDRPWVQLSIEQAVATNTDYDVEYRTIWADGSTHWVLVRGRCFYNPDGTPRRMVGMSMDLTDRKRAELEREQLLAQAQAAQTQAEAANRTKDQFLAVLSHELRSPLNPILGWAKLLRTREFEPAVQQKAIETIERNAKLQSQLIEDLLDISRILNGKLTLESGLVDLESTLRGALDTVQLAADAKAIQICTVLEPLQIWGDANRLQQVSWNLLSNAIKFTPNGGSVTLKLEQQGTQAQITVSDTGKGISPSFLPYVFDSFRQADGSTTRKFGGLGLGLAIVRQVVELHGGTVRAESLGEGQGSTFIVQIPCQTLAPNSHPLVPSQPLLHTNRLPLSAIQVLLVDDDDDSRGFAAFVLEQSGAIVTAAASAREALIAIASFSPDILVSDIGMPVLDGYELIHQIRSLPTRFTQSLPAIALTAYAGEVNQQQALNAGFQMHLAKPIEPDKLVQAIGELLELGWQPSGSGDRHSTEPPKFF